MSLQGKQDGEGSIQREEVWWEVSFRTYLREHRQERVKIKPGTFCRIELRDWIEYINLLYISNISLPDVGGKPNKFFSDPKYVSNPTLFLDPQFLRTQSLFWTQNLFWTKIYFESKIYFGPKICFGPKFVWT